MYAASVNPPRRAKLQAAASLLPALLPSPPGSVSPPHSFSLTATSSSPDPIVQPRKKRGRKPATGASSRAAREAARKANHSRIEKARRGKINNALQELKNLIPADFAAQSANEDDEGDDFDDSVVSPTSKKDSGKKTSSEREFKLDILERTVLFVRDLLHRVKDNGPSGTSDATKRREDCQCQCFHGGNTRKRDSEEMKAEPGRKKHRTNRFETYNPGQLSDEDAKDADIESNTSNQDEDDATEDVDYAMPSSSTSETQTNRIRLPSISELFPSQDGSTITAQAIVVQLPSPSLSPLAFPQHYRSGDVNKRPYLSPSLSPSGTLRGSLSPRDGRPCGRLDEIADGRASCQVGMSALLTPPSTSTGSMPRHNAPGRTPTFCLPSSALDVRDVSLQSGRPGRSEEEEEDDIDVDVDVDTGDGGARAASFALLQMRGRSYSRSEVKSALDSSERLSLTPGGLLGIRTGVQS